MKVQSAIHVLFMAVVLLGASAVTACLITCTGKYTHITGDGIGGCFGFDNTDPITTCSVNALGASYTFFPGYGCTGQGFDSSHDTTHFSPPIQFSSLRLTCPKVPTV